MKCATNILQCSWRKTSSNYTLQITIFPINQPSKEICHQYMELSTHNKTLKAEFFHRLLTMFGMKSQTNTTKQDIFICRGVTNLIQINNKMANYI